MPLVKSRTLFMAAFLLTSGLIGFALYLEYFQNIPVCPLCMLQRIVFGLLGLLALSAVIHNPTVKGLRVYGIFSMFIAAGGIGLAARHVWLESLPPHLAPACGPSLEIMLQYLPLFEVLKTAIMGSGDCAKVAWSFMGLSVANWALAFFGFLFVVYTAITIKPVGRF